MKSMSDYGRRGGLARAHRYVIDNKQYTVAEISKKLGVGYNATIKRLKKRKHTWQSLMNG